MESVMVVDLEDLKKTLKLSGKTANLLASFIFRIGKLQPFNDLYFRYRNLSGEDFVDQVLKSQNIKIKYDRKKLEQIRMHKSLIVLSNHLHGILDGLIALQLFMENGIKRAKVIANPLLASIKPLSDHLIIVNSFDESDDYQLSFRGCKNVLSAFKQDGYLIFFPSADVSLFSWKEFGVVDPPWNRTFFKLIEKSDHPILPIFIKGRNSSIYQVMRLIHPKLGLLGLIPAFFKKKDISIEIRIGKIFTKQHIDTKDLPGMLRKKVYDLKNGAPAKHD
jgi:putative hemolysin